MSFNPLGATPLSLNNFGSLVTEAKPEDLPLGLSPDNSDVEFGPGTVSTRRGLSRVYTTPLGICTITYAKTSITPDGTIYNLVLDSQGNFWVENVTAGTVPAISFATTPGSYAKSVTAFGREYIAISDGLAGTDFPWQFVGSASSFYFDRVTQDGPAVAPTITNVALPLVNMAVSSTPSTLTVTECDPAGFNGSSYTSINIFVPTVGTAYVGESITIAGSSSSPMNGTYNIVAVYPGSGGGGGLIVAAAYFPNGTLYGLGGTGTLNGGTTMTRANNLVTVTTVSAHQLQVGYQAQITGIPAFNIAIAFIQIDNEDFPGIASIVTTTNHGLSPGQSISITGVQPQGSVAITSAARAGGVTTFITASAHGLQPGASIVVSGTADATFSGAMVVYTVVDAVTFTVLQDTMDGMTTGGSLALYWPIPDTAQPTYFQIIACPNTNNVQIALNYCDSTFTGGTIGFAWDGTFFVTAVLNVDTFQYKQNGPDATSSTVGTVKPNGQAAPGQHQVQFLYQTRNAAITIAGPPTVFIANGGQYLSITNIPIGPANVTLVIMAFTGANGDLFYYIPVSAQVNGQVVSTSTVVPNGTESAFLDFSDNTLYAALGINISGNNLPTQVKLDSVLGFAYYTSRLLAYGMRNQIQNFLNMGFDGGYTPLSGIGSPNGWTLANTSSESTVTLVPGRSGYAWAVTIINISAPTENYGKLEQSAYQDAYGAPIVEPLATYKMRFWVKSSLSELNIAVTFDISSASTSFNSGAAVAGATITTAGGWVEAVFDTPMPASIPSDMMLQFAVTASTGVVYPVTITVDDMSLIDLEEPFENTLALGSYINNPEGFSGVTGQFGPTTDTRKIMNFGMVNDVLYLLTQDPNGRLHEIAVNGVTEPAGWSVDQIASQCGILSTFGLTVSQANDATGSGGERWFAWASKSGARIFGGGQPWKISQEIQPDWGELNQSAYTTIWALNDPDARIIYFGTAIIGDGAPSLIYPLNYKDLDTAEQISEMSPVIMGSFGIVSAGDRSRKWTRWQLPMNGAALLSRPDGSQQICFFGGTGDFPSGEELGFGNLYYLTKGRESDDDYGQIDSYYITYGFPQAEQAQQLKLGSGRVQCNYLSAIVSGKGNCIITPYKNSVTRPWPLRCVRTLSNPSVTDLEWPGGNIKANRIFFKIQSTPITGSDSHFSLSQLVTWLKPAPIQVRGAAEAIARQTLNILQLNKFDPRYTIYMRGFDRRGCAAAITQATANSFRVTGNWSDLADFVVLMLWDADDIFGHLFTSRYLPDFNMRGLVLTFSLSITNGMYPGSSKSPSVPWNALSYILQNGTSGTIPLVLSNGIGQTQASANFTIQGTCVEYDRIQLVFLSNYVFDYVCTGTDTPVTVATSLVAQINAQHTADPATVFITAQILTGSTFQVNSTLPGTDGNTIELLARYKTSTTTIEPSGLVKLTGGTNPTAFDVTIDFSGLSLFDVRQCWLTLSPPLPIDSTSIVDTTLVPFTALNFSYLFNNWSVADSSSNRLLKIAGIGSTTVGNGNPLSIYTGTGWTQQSGSYFQGYIQGSSVTNDSVSITYECGCLHDLFVGTALYTDRGILGVTLDGSALGGLDCYLNTDAELVTRRQIAQNVAAGTHTVVLTITGTKNASSTGYTCYYDFLQAAVPGDIIQPHAPNPRLNAAWDFDTLYNLPPSRLFMISQMLGFAGDIDFYGGVLFGAKRARFGGYFTTWVVTLSGTWNDGSGFGDGDAIYISISGVALGASVFPLDASDNLALAQRFADAINSIFVGVRATATGDAATAVLTVYLLSPINGFMDPAPTLSTSVGATGSATATGSLAAGQEGIWQIDATQTQPINKALADYLRDFSQIVKLAGQTATVAFSQELLAPPDVDTVSGAWSQRFAGDYEQVLTATGFGSWGTGYVMAISGSGPQQITSDGHGYSTGYEVHVIDLTTSENRGAWLITVVDVNNFQLTTFVAGSGTGTAAVVGDQIYADLQTSQCNFNPSTVTPYMANQYKQAAQIIASVGAEPWLQFGEILWWFFSGGSETTMAYYDDYTAETAAAILGRALYVFTDPNNDPSVNNYQDANVLRGMLQKHLLTVRQTVFSAVPNARFEILWPDDVNWPTTYQNATYPYPIGGALNRYVNLPENILNIGGVIDRWKTEALAWGGTYLTLDNAITSIQMAPQNTNWPRNQGRYLVPWNTPQSLWRQELPQAFALLESASSNINLWAIDHVILFSWDIATVIDSFLGGGNSGQ